MNPLDQILEKVLFDGILKYYPMNVDIVGLRHSSCIASIKKKLLDSTLNDTRFTYANAAS